VIIGAFLIILLTSLLDSVVSVVIQTRGGNFLPVILIFLVTTVSLRIAHSNREQNVSSTILWVIGWCPAVYLCAIVGFYFYSPSTMINAIIAGGVVYLYCRSIYETPDLRIKMTYLFASTKASMTNIAIGYGNVRNPIWSNCNGFRTQLFLVSQEAYESIIYLMKERPTLPVSYTHLEDFDYISILKEDGWPNRIRNLLNNLEIEGLRSAPPLLEKGARALPLILQDNVDTRIEYGITTDTLSTDILIKDWPASITIFPGKNGLRAVVPLNKAPGIDLYHLSKIEVLRILVERDNRAFPQGGVENVNSS
jgi:hypothetical protein